MTDALQESAKQNPTSEEIMLPSSPYLTNAHAPIFQTSLATQYSLPEDLSIGKQPSNTATVRLTTQTVSSLFFWRSQSCEQLRRLVASAELTNCSWVRTDLVSSIKSPGISSLAYTTEIFLFRHRALHVTPHILLTVYFILCGFLSRIVDWTVLLPLFDWIKSLIFIIYSFIYGIHTLQLKKPNQSRSYLALIGLCRSYRKYNHPPGGAGCWLRLRWQCAVSRRRW